MQQRIVMSCRFHRTCPFLLFDQSWASGRKREKGRPRNQVPVRYVREQHVREDLGRIPTAQDSLLQIKPQRWMYGQRLDEEKPKTKEDPV
jgi:hypothetical protein